MECNTIAGKAGKAGPMSHSTALVMWCDGDIQEMYAKHRDLPFSTLDSIRLDQTSFG